MTSTAYTQPSRGELDLRCYLNPIKARDLREKSTERVLASLALRNIWHVIFDPCPGVLALSPPDGKTLLEAFLVWAERAQVSMSWGLHIQLLDWLYTQTRWREQLSEDIVKELMVASALRWSQSNMSDLAHLDAKTIILRSPWLDETAVGARKSVQASAKASVHLLTLPKLAAATHNQYCYGYKQDGWELGAWHAVPG